MKILFWLDGNGDLKAFTPGYGWVCGEARESVSLPFARRKELLKIKIFERVASSGARVSEVEVWDTDKR